jgi:hypothetical protein
MTDSKPNHPHGLLGLAQAWLPVLTVVVGALWALYTYLDHAKQAATAASEAERNLATEHAIQSERESRTRLIEAQKPFLDKQLALYFETAQVVGRLVTEGDGLEWGKDRARFEELYWSELAMVEHAEVASAMVEFRQVLEQLHGSPPPNRGDLLRVALGVAHSLRKGVEESWGNATDTQNKIVAPYDK